MRFPKIKTHLPGRFWSTKMQFDGHQGTSSQFLPRKPHAQARTSHGLSREIAYSDLVSFDKFEGGCNDWCDAQRHFPFFCTFVLC